MGKFKNIFSCFSTKVGSGSHEQDGALSIYDLSEFLSFLLTHKRSSDCLVSCVDGNRTEWRNPRFWRISTSLVQLGNHNLFFGPILMADDGKNKGATYFLDSWHHICVKAYRLQFLRRFADPKNGWDCPNVKYGSSGRVVSFLWEDRSPESANLRKSQVMVKSRFGGRENAHAVWARSRDTRLGSI